MTREEAIIILGNIPIDDDECYSIPQYQEAKTMAIEALEQLTSYEQTINKLTEAISEQATILDKIRAEIEQGYCVVNNDYDHGRNYGLYMTMQIIDKYRSELDCRECKAEYECYYCKKYAESEET